MKTAIQIRVSTTGHAFDKGFALGRAQTLSNEPIDGPRGSEVYDTEAEINSFINGVQAGYNAACWEIQDLAWAAEDTALANGTAQA